MGLKQNQFLSRNSKGEFIKIEQELLITKPSVQLAELIGIILGDGNIYIKEEFSCYQVRITGHRINDRDYLLNYVKSIFEKLFGSWCHVKFPKNSKAIVLSINSKCLVFTLLNFGLFSGNKLKNNVGIPKWIFSKKQYMRACIRGLIDTDGCVYPKTLKHITPSIWFTSAIPRLRNDFKKCLTLLDYKASKWVDRTKRGKNLHGVDCSIGNRKYVLKYFKEIGFSNQKHLIRFKKFWKLS